MAQAGAPEGSGISRRLWEDSLDDVYESLHHPFVRALAAGTLPKCAVAILQCAAHGNVCP